MRKEEYSNYIDDGTVIKVCNGIGFHNINSSNIFRSKIYTYEVVVADGKSVAIITLDEMRPSNTFSVEIMHYDILCFDNPSSYNFNNLSDNDKLNLFYNLRDIDVYENKDHPDILFAMDAWKIEVTYIDNEGTCHPAELNMPDSRTYTLNN